MPVLKALYDPWVLFFRCCAMMKAKERRGRPWTQERPEASSRSSGGKRDGHRGACRTALGNGQGCFALGNRKGFPDASLLPSLAGELGVSVGELLAGKTDGTGAAPRGNGSRHSGSAALFQAHPRRGGVGASRSRALFCCFRRLSRQDRTRCSLSGLCCWQPLRCFLCGEERGRK